MRKPTTYFLLILLSSMIIACSKKPPECPFDVNAIDFTFGIDYDHPEKYLIPGEQSSLSDENFEMAKKSIGRVNNNLFGVLGVCYWVNNYFSFDDAGGAMMGKVTVDELFEIRKFYGCHSQSLIISTLLRKFGFPSVMIETADIQWGYDQREEVANYMKGHVMTEVYVDSAWILLDNNCTYILEYDYSNPYISRKSWEIGWFVFAKGTDTWEYSNKDESFTDTNMFFFSDNIHCYEHLFYTLRYDWDEL